MTETQRYLKLRELFPFARGATVDELIESQARLVADAQALGQTQQLSPEGATTQQVPPREND